MTRTPSSPLDWFEYVGVVFVLVVSVVLICWKRSTGSTASGLTNTMSLGPVVISLIASSTSGMSMLAKPTDAYKHGIEFFVVSSAFNLSIFIISAVVFMPVIFKLEEDSIYQYFERRFNKSVRHLTSASFIISKIFSSAIVALPPCIVINHFSGISTRVIICFMLLITTFYTTLGGYVGVVWTDAFQGVVMFATMMALSVMSIAGTGGPGEILRIAHESGRMTLPETPIDPTARLPIWTYLVPLSGISTVVLNQSMFQRYKSLEKKRDMTLSLYLQFIGITFFSFSALVIGLSVYAYYYGCDPKSAKIVDSYTNVIVYWLDNVGQNVKGFRGAYIAGITCASISTVSTHLNSCAGLISRDFFPLMGLLTHQKKFAFSVKLSTAIVGLLATILAASFNGTSSLLELSYYLSSIDGIIAGFFILGVLFVPANTKGTLFGGVVAVVFNIVMLTGSRIYAAKGLLPSYPVHNMRTDKCLGNITFSEPITSSNAAEVTSGSLSDIFRLSPFILPPLVTFLTVLVGYLASLLCNDDSSDTTRNPSLYSPLAFRLFERKMYETKTSANIQLLKTSPIIK